MEVGTICKSANMCIYTSIFIFKCLYLYLNFYTVLKYLYLNYYTVLKCGSASFVNFCFSVCKSLIILASTSEDSIFFPLNYFFFSLL